MLPSVDAVLKLGRSGTGVASSRIITGIRYSFNCDFVASFTIISVTAIIFPALIVICVLLLLLF